MDENENKKASPAGPSRVQGPTVRDVTLLNRLFPDARTAAFWLPPALADVFSECDVVLDTNVLLLPYNAGGASLQAVEETFRALAGSSRLFLPERAVREFSRHKASKIVELQKRLEDHHSTVAQPPQAKFPQLEGLAEYAKLSETAAKLKELTKEYQVAVMDMIGAVRRREWRDPVAEMYAKVFDVPEIIVGHQESDSGLRDLLVERFTDKIPPGYKDAGKEDGGVGDLEIWLTILKLGAERKRPLLFVTGEEKPDWVHKVAKGPGLPRIELVDEYRRVSAGKSFHICQLSELLELTRSSPVVVAEVKREEARLRTPVVDETGLRTDRPQSGVSEEELRCPACGSAVQCRIASHVGASAKPTCPACGLSFHAHWTKLGVVVRRPNSRRAERELNVHQMVTWFHQRYMDPANGVPHDSEEGYLYTNGGPYDAYEVLHDEFGDVFPSDVIDEAATLLESEGGAEWVLQEDY